VETIDALLLEKGGKWAHTEGEKRSLTSGGKKGSITPTSFLKEFKTETQGPQDPLKPLRIKNAN